MSFPLLSAVLVAVLGLFVFSRDPKSVVNRLFGAISVVCVMWLFGTFMMFSGLIRGADEATVLFWDRFVYLGIVFVPALEYHFGLTLSRRKPDVALYAAYALSVLFLILSRLDPFISGLFRYEWGGHAVAGPLHHAFLIFFLLYILAFFRILYGYYRTATDRNERAGLIVAATAFGILDVVGGLGFLPAYGIGIFPISLIAPTAFVLVIGYSIVRYGLFDIETVTAQVSVGAILFLMVAQFLFRDTAGSSFLDPLMFLSVALVGYFLVRSVKRDLARKEELQEISDSLAKANERLKELDNTKTEFISIASHQLRTPLTAIKGYLSLLLEGSYGEIPSEVADVLGKMSLVNRGLVQLVEDLLNVSRIDAGRISYSFEPTSVEALIAERIDLFMPMAREKDLLFRIRLPKDPLPELMLDQGKIREAVSNLIDNAIKYTKRGFVEVSVEAVGSEAVRITVADSGIGFRKGEESGFFGKFIRTKDTTREYVSGTGLGLYVGASFVDAHGGRMWAESDGPGTGARFIIELPFRNPRAEAAETTAAFGTDGR